VLQNYIIFMSLNNQKLINHQIMKKILFSVVMLLLFILTVDAQYTTKRISKAQQAYTDSLKNVKYDYFFPLLGQGAYSEGYDIPYPVGIMANFFWADQGILINNLQLGYKNAYNPGNSFELRPILDENGKELIKFGKNRNVSYS